MRRFITGVILGSVMVIAGLFALSGQASAQAGCDDYAIMRCGAADAGGFIAKTVNNAPGDLKAIYAHYGLVPADYARFGNTAKHGTLYKDGRIVVDGVTVGRSTQNVGRVRDANFNERVTINDKNYWGGSFGSTYHANTADVMVMFNDRGVMEFAVISSCGNPQQITSNKPDYSCDLLKKSKVQDVDNRYRFTTDATASQGAEVVKAVYDFGDGTTKTVTSLDQPVEHTFKTSSTIRVTVTVRLPGGSTQTVTSADCVTQVTVETKPAPQNNPKPYAVCTRLEATPIDQASRRYKFTAYADYGGGAVFNGADFNFGDGSSMTNVRPNGNTAIINHNYGKAGTYEILATLHFTDANGRAINADCTASISPADVVEYCKPNIPVGSKDCEEQLVAAGPGAVIAGLFGGAGSVAAAGHYFRRRLLGL